MEIAKSEVIKDGNAVLEKQEQVLNMLNSLITSKPNMRSLAFTFLAWICS